MVVNRQPPNLGRLIVSSRLKTDSHYDADNFGTHPCGDARCRTCRHVNNDIQLTRNNFTFRVRGRFSCRSSGVVYLIRCNLCPVAWYIGETCNPLRTRLTGHRQTITHENISVPVGQHFNLPGHSLDNLNVLVLKGGLHDINNRIKFETEMIIKFGTHMDGLNRDVNFMSHYKAIL